MFAIHSIKGSAQTPGLSFDHLTVSNGLSYDKVRSIIQDRQGFMWMGTINGLNRYDGRRFKIFYADIKDSSSLPDNRVQRLYEDSKGNLWVCTLSGVSLYDPLKEKFANFYGRNQDGTPIGYTCYDIVECDDQYWVATVRGIRKLNLQTHTLDPVPGKHPSDFINSRTFYQLLNTSPDHLLAASFEGLVQFDIRKNAYGIIPLHDDDPLHDRANNSISYLTQDHQKNIWLGTWSGGLKKWDPVSHRFSTFLFSNKPAYTMSHNIARYLVVSKQSGNQLWVSSAGEGLHRFDMINESFQSWFTTDPNDRYGIPPGGIFCIFEDRQFRLWIGGDKGIYIYDPAKQLTLQKKPAWLKAADCQNEIVSIYQDPADKNDNTYFISTWNCGFYKTDSTFLQSLPFDNTLKRLSASTPPLTVLSFLRDRQDNLWLATGSGGVYCVSEHKKNVRHWNATGDAKNKPGSSAGRYFRHLLQDRNGTIWACTASGLVYYDTGTDKFTVFPHPQLGKASIADLKEDNKGNLWAIVFCNDEKEALLYRIHLDDHTTTPFRHPIMDRLTCVSQQGLKKIFIDQQNMVWITSTAGLLKIAASGDSTRWQLFAEKEGLPAAHCDRVLAQNDQYLWIGTANGLALFNKATGKAEKNYSIADGLLLTDLDGQYFYKDNKDRLFISGQNGNFNIIEKKSLPDMAQPVPVVLTGIKILNKDYLPGNSSIPTLHELRISYRQNNLQFEFAALDYTHPGQQQYAYILEGLDDDWVYTQQPFAVYNNLAGGQYTFRVKALGKDGNWNKNEIALKLLVKPPFWKTFWFRFGAIIVIIILVYWAFSRRINTIRKEGTLKQLKAEAETKALRSQMNPHFIFNCMNTIDAYILKNKQEEASEILQKFSGLMRQVLHNSRFDKITIEKELKALELYVELEEHILENRFTHRFSIGSSLLEQPYAIPPLLLQPYVENAILHGLRHKETKDGLLLIDLQLQGNSIHCIIEDNGVGRRCSAAIYKNNTFKNDSLGMQVTEERIENLNQFRNQKFQLKITDIDEAGMTGTKIEISFPAELITQKNTE